jgi:hypothetical protein
MCRLFSVKNIFALLMGIDYYLSGNPKFDNNKAELPFGEVSRLKKYCFGKTNYFAMVLYKSLC